MMFRLILAGLMCALGVLASGNPGGTQRREEELERNVVLRNYFRRIEELERREARRARQEARQQARREEALREEKDAAAREEEELNSGFGVRGETTSVLIDGEVDGAAHGEEHDGKVPIE